MGLKKYIAKRTFYCLIVLWFIMTINFVIFVAMPGDPVARWVKAQEGMVSRDELEALRKLYGLEMSLTDRYFLYIKNMITWNFGRSRHVDVPIAQEISLRLGHTLYLMGTAAFFSIMIGTLLGVLIASRRGSKTDTGVVTGALILGSLPVFWIGWLILFFFALYLNWFPIGGIYPKEWIGRMPTDPLQIIWGRLLHMALPALTLITLTMSGWMLLTRQCILEIITEDYVVTAKAKGLRERTVLLKHVLKPASLPLVTSVALTIAGLWSGAIVTETLFSYEGMGRWIWNAISVQDIPVLYVVFYISALTIVIANFVVDLVYGLIDPRIKVGR
ncbi:MAG: dipeptide transporter permease DppB [Candidatus Bathyarchaeota archaeon BA1]|nr:MAG: dipeptide transporter permease DppB [Candidatus Bathyarchaeota archaeon BA1]